MIEQHHGLNLPRDPHTHPVMSGSAPEQSQEWPGRDSELRPQADHGEETYRGGGKLEGLKALITGGDSGIGRATAIAFAREGADVAITYLNEHEDAEETRRWVEKAGRKAALLPADLQKHDNCQEVVRRAVEELGGLNILVNNAAYHIETGDFREIPPEQIEQTFRTNIFAYIWVAQEAVKHMRSGDVIINTGSVVGYMPYPRLTDYSATKAAIHSFTKNAAATLADEGIRVNCVAPGPVWTPLIASTRDEEFVGHFGENSYWKRPGAAGRTCAKLCVPRLCRFPLLYGRDFQPKWLRRHDPLRRRGGLKLGSADRRRPPAARPRWRSTGFDGGDQNPDLGGKPWIRQTCPTGCDESHSGSLPP